VLRDKTRTISWRTGSKVRYSGSSHSIVIILTDKRIQFKSEILRAINKEKLHNEVLQDQNVFDFESYKQMMGLVTVYVTELTLMKN
jgi:hypothetical protein